MDGGQASRNVRNPVGGRTHGKKYIWRRILEAQNGGGGTAIKGAHGAPASYRSSRSSQTWRNRSSMAGQAARGCRSIERDAPRARIAARGSTRKARRVCAGAAAPAPPPPPARGFAPRVGAKFVCGPQPPPPPPRAMLRVNTRAAFAPARTPADMFSAVAPVVANRIAMLRSGVPGWCRRNQVGALDVPACHKLDDPQQLQAGIFESLASARTG
jgi:hypothetical protein